MPVSSESIFSTLAEPRRLQIVELLAAEGELNSSDISGRFDVTSAAVSQHLKILREAGVLIMNKRAQNRLYRINPEAITALESWTKRMKKTWSQRLDQLDELLKQPKPNQGNL